MNMSAQDAVNTLYIGGGTPSVLPLDVLSRIVGAVSQTERLSLVTEQLSLVTEPVEVTKCRKGKAVLCAGDSEKKAKVKFCTLPKFDF